MKLPEILEEGFKNQWIESMTDGDYHADRTAVSSSAVRVVRKSPKAFHAAFVEGIEEKDESSAMIFGSAAHLAILEPEKFDSRYVTQPDFGDMRSPRNREKRDAWLESLPKDSVPMSEEELGKLKRMIDSLLGHTVAVNMLKLSVKEPVGYFRDPETGLKCRIKPDSLRYDLTVLSDLKTTRDASRRAFSRAIWERRYDMQLAFYAHGIQQIQGKLPGNSCFITVENQSPYDVAVYVADAGMMDKGMNDVRLGLNRIKECLVNGTWPGYQQGNAEEIALPAYAFGFED